MKNMKKLIALLLALVMVVGIMAGCTGGSDTTPSDEGTQGATDGTQGATDTTGAAVEDGPQYGGHLNVRIASTLTGLDPLKQTGIWKYVWTLCVFEGALSRDAENVIQPGVCDFELSEDQLTLKLWVRDNKVFHNGDPVDIYDVEASYQRAFNLYSSIQKKCVPYVESMEVQEDGKTLVLKFTEWREDVYYYLCSWQTWAAIMPKEICEKYGEELNTITLEDTIGTGPYKVTDFETNVSLTITKWEDYVIPEEDKDKTGYATAKYGYMDTMTFYENRDDSSASLALLSGEYDVIECIASDYKDMWEGEGIVETTYPTLTGCHMYFQGFGLNNVCAKYPSLRKAVMAAIDYEEFLKVVTDDQQVMGGCPIVNEKYYTDVFETADYYGAANQEVVDKYVAAAKEEGWNGTDPVVVVTSDHRGDVVVLLNDYLTKAGIPVKAEAMESTAISDFKANPENVWDVDFSWPSYNITPTLLSATVLTTYWNNEEKDALIEEMKLLNVDSDEYMAKWEELAEMWVDDCCTAYMSMIQWYWYHPEGLVTNDNDVTQRHFFNAYWTNPEEHQA